MRTSALLFVTFACTLLEGARGGCSGQVRSYSGGHSHAGCHEVYVSCWTKLGDRCEYDFDLPPWSGGYERVKEFTGHKDTIYKAYPSTDSVLVLTGRNALNGKSHGQLHCGSDDGSPQLKNYEDVVVCRKKVTPSPTHEPTVSPTLKPTVSPTPAPTASVPLSSDAVRQALDGLCASLADAEECRAEAPGVMASLIAGATADGEADDDYDDDWRWDDAAEGGSIDVVAAAAAGLAGGTGLAATPLLLAAAVAVAAVAFATSRFGRGNGNNDGNNRREYAPVPDEAGA